MNFSKNPMITNEELEVKIAAYLIQNPAPTDLQFHALAAGLGVPKERLEEVSYKMLATVINCASIWGLLNQDPNAMHSAMYMAGCDPETAITDIIKESPDLSPNVIDLMLRVRKTDALNKVFTERNRILSYAEEQDVELVTEKKHGDVVQVTDPNRIVIVTQNLNQLGMSQSEIDTTLRLLNMDRYSDDSALLNSSYNSMREALVSCTTFAFDDPLFKELANKFIGLSSDRRDYGDKIRIAKVRQCCRLMRAITERYGVANRGLFSSIGADR